MASFVSTPIDEIPKLVAGTRAYFRTGATKPIAWRKAQLRGLYKMIAEHKEAICESCSVDFGKPRAEAMLAEVLLNLNHIAYVLENLDEWVKPDKPAKGTAEMGADLSVVKEPFGVCLVIAPFNYPWDLILKPLTVALAAGNVCVLKPSEMTPACAMLMSSLIPKYMDPKAVAFVNGGVKETTVLLENQFDHILYTGNGTVGRIVMGAAAKHLTPVVLELGGKSPVIIDPSMAEKDMELVGRRVSWGRFANAGQTCIAPDYAMVPKRLLPAFVASVKKAIGEFYGPDPMNSGDLARVINATHTKRIGALIDEEKAAGSKIEAGGQWDAEKCRVAPTVVVTTFDGALMRGEIFGPVLPVIAVETVDEMIEHVNAGDRPLALYAFTHDTKLATRIHSEAISGGVTINEVMLHAAADSAPFGGVGASGMGYHHGRYGFEIYTHKKTVLVKDLGAIGEKLNYWVGKYPPYSKEGTDRMLWIAGKSLPSEGISMRKILAVGAAVGVGYLLASRRK